MKLKHIYIYIFCRRHVHRRQPAHRLHSDWQTRTECEVVQERPGDLPGPPAAVGQESGKQLLARAAQHPSHRRGRVRILCRERNRRGREFFGLLKFTKKSVFY